MQPSMGLGPTVVLTVRGDLAKAGRTFHDREIVSAEVVGEVWWSHRAAQLTVCGAPPWQRLATDLTSGGPTQGPRSANAAARDLKQAWKGARFLLSGRTRAVLASQRVPGAQVIRAAHLPSALGAYSCLISERQKGSIRGLRHAPNPNIEAIDCTINAQPAATATTAGALPEEERRLWDTPGHMAVEHEFGCHSPARTSGGFLHLLPPPAEKAATSS